jgi:hypothetical protein
MATPSRRNLGRMVDPRVYRAAFVPLLLALFVVAFSLERRPPAATSTLTADAFDGGDALGEARALAREFPRRPPGSAQEEALAARLRTALRADGFQVSRRTRDGSETVVAVRPGVLSRRIVVTADRAAATSPGLAELSGTAALLELARIFRSTSPERSAGPDGTPLAVGRDLRRTLVLVSTSGASLGKGAAGAEAIGTVAGPASRIDAVLALGDLGGELVRKPWVVTWAGDGSAGAPLGLGRTVEVAARAETGAAPGGPRASGQWARRAFGLTPSAQGELAAAGLPAVLLQVSGERGPEPGTRVLESRMSAFGRTTLRAISAIDGVGAPAAGSRRREPADGGPPAFGGETAGIVTLRRVLPDWAVRLLVGTALLPALFAALDAFFRARRRGLRMGVWLGWAALAGVPLLFAYGWLRLLDAVGAIAAPSTPVLPRTVPFGWAEAAVVVSAVAIAGLAAVAVHRALQGLVGPGERRDLPIGGAATVVGLTLALLTALIWVVNPYAAALLVPAAHAWLLASDPGIRLSRVGAGALVAVGIVAPLLVVLHDASALGLGPLDVGWLGVLLAAGGHLGVLAAATLALLVACGLRTVALVVAQGRLPRAPSTTGTLPPVLRTRGPAGYAGPGSLGGTESALRR